MQYPKNTKEWNMKFDGFFTCFHFSCVFYRIKKKKKSMRKNIIVELLRVIPCFQNFLSHINFLFFSLIIT